jgi:uncharacterized protein (TIGR02646 family)
MNKIFKKEEAPEVLRTKGVELRDSLIAQADAGNTAFCFDNKVFAHKTVKEQMMEDQHRKCAYCEQYKNGDFGCVEHYRPKGGYDLGSGAPLQQPGYYWLAYDWQNLLFSCSECNTSYKRNHFPLVNENARDIEHRDITNEEPAIINPVTTDPRDHIEFSEFIIRPKMVDGQESIQGKTTIGVFRLNDRKDLKERRRNAWEAYNRELVKKAIFLKLNNADGVALCDETLEQMKDDEAEFCGMFKNQVK